MWVRCRGLAIRDKDGKTMRMLGAHTDVTALKHAEERIRRLASELEVKNGELEGFAYSVSHDLRAPLHVIDGFAFVLEQDHGGELSEEGRRLLDVIRKNTRKMGRLINDLLVFFRLSQRPAELQQVEMTALARAALEEAKSQEPARRIDCRLAELPTVFGDPAMLQQVWVNLLTNAVKFTRPRTEATIEISGRKRCR